MEIEALKQRIAQGKATEGEARETIQCWQSLSTLNLPIRRDVPWAPELVMLRVGTNSKLTI